MWTETVPIIRIQFVTYISQSGLITTIEQNILHKLCLCHWNKTPNNTGAKKRKALMPIPLWSQASLLHLWGLLSSFFPPVFPDTENGLLHIQRRKRPFYDFRCRMVTNMIETVFSTDLQKDGSWQGNLSVKLWIWNMQTCATEACQGKDIFGWQEFPKTSSNNYIQCV